MKFVWSMNSLLLFTVCTSRVLWRLEWLIDNARLSSPLPFLNLHPHSAAKSQRWMAPWPDHLGNRENPPNYLAFLWRKDGRRVREQKNGLRSYCPCEELLFHPNSWIEEKDEGGEVGKLLWVARTRGAKDSAWGPGAAGCGSSAHKWKGKVFWKLVKLSIDPVAADKVTHFTSWH